MPLDARKTAHILAVVNESYAFRQHTVVFVYLTAGVYSFVATSVIMRPEQIIDITLYTAGGNQPPQVADQVMIAPLGTNFTGVIYIADTVVATAAGVASSDKYEVVEALPVGIVPGGSHIRALLRRLR